MSEALENSNVVIIGAGPAGLTAAYLLAKHGTPLLVLEADPTYVGGISRTVRYKDFRFDIGGHRFFSKSKEIEDLWTEILPQDMLVRPRLSRIFYRKKFYSYPLNLVETLQNLGIVEAVLCSFSYLKAKLLPRAKTQSFEAWVSSEFGHRLFSIFFKTYTEKVWGMSCKDISSDWATQRIKDLSFASAVKQALFPKKKKVVIKSLVSSFRYPRKGPGMMWEACSERVTQWGGKIQLGRRVSALKYEASTCRWIITHEEKVVYAKHLISSMPIRELVELLSHSLSDTTKQAAKSLKYRDFITVVLITKDSSMFNDNWIYIHDPSVKVGRIQNFKSWSPEMVPDPSYSCYGLEYFCFDGDGLWNQSDAELIELGKKEMAYINLIKPESVIDACVVRQLKAYPVYDQEYSKNVEIIRKELESNFPTLHLVGRNGMHKYNNQDHSMMTALLSAKNILAGKKIYNVWGVNQDAEYLESEKIEMTGSSGIRHVPVALSDTPLVQREISVD